MCLPFHHAGTIGSIIDGMPPRKREMERPHLSFVATRAFCTEFREVTPSGKISMQVTAMHGWAGDSRCWAPWIRATADLGWDWQCGERGYGLLGPRQAAWPVGGASDTKRLAIGHSLGPHLIETEVLASADLVVLLASFAAFVPPGRNGRRAHSALEAMMAKLGSQFEARQMLEKFLNNAAAPQQSRLMPPGPLDGPLHLERLRDDLETLRLCEALPAGITGQTRVLIVEAGEDRIVEPFAQTMLREQLPEARVIRLAGTGHALLDADVVAKVVAWAVASPL